MAEVPEVARAAVEPVVDTPVEAQVVVVIPAVVAAPEGVAEVVVPSAPIVAVAADPSAVALGYFSEPRRNQAR